MDRRRVAGAAWVASRHRDADRDQGEDVCAAERRANLLERRLQRHQPTADARGGERTGGEDHDRSRCHEAAIAGGARRVPVRARNEREGEGFEAGGALSPRQKWQELAMILGGVSSPGMAL